MVGLKTRSNLLKKRISQKLNKVVYKHGKVWYNKHIN